MEEQGPQFSKPDPPANPGKAVSPKISNRTRLSHCTFIHILYFGIFQRRTGRDRVGQRLRQEGEGGAGSPFPSHPSWPCHTGSTHKRGRGGTEAPSVEEAAQSYTHATHIHTPTHTHAHTRTSPLHTGRAGSQRSRALWGQGQGSNSLLTDRRPAPPAPSNSIPKVSPEAPPPYALPGHSLLASSFFPAAGDEKKRGTEQGGVHPSAPFLMLGGLSPGRPQDRLLAGHSLVEVDVA